MKYSSMIMFSCLSFVVNAQISFEKSYQHNTTLKNTGQSYYYIESDSFQIHFYSTDHNLVKTLSPLLNSGDYIMNILVVYDELFDTDNNDVEILLTYMNTSVTPIQPYILLCDWDGNLIKDFGGYYYGNISYDGNKFKLLLYFTNWTSAPQPRGMHVYSLPGTYFNTLGLRSAKPTSNQNPFPNPTTDFIYIPCPSTIGSGDIEIFNDLGGIVESRKINGEKVVLIDVRGYTKGVYLYRINSGEQSGQFVVE